MSTNKQQTATGARRRRDLANISSPRIIGQWQLDIQVDHGPLTDIFYARPLGCRPDWPADYALKTLRAPHDEDSLAIQLLRREAEVGRQVSHPHLVPILDAQTNSAPYHIVMPRLTGASVKAAVERVGHFEVGQALWITRQVAEALAALHESGWLHGDVKPANMMVSKAGHTTLIDLGCALRDDESMLTWDRPVVGTLHYVAPEMVTSRLRTDARSDVYSLGISLFEMLTGRLPFQQDDPAKLVEAHLREPAPDPSVVVTTIPKPIADLVRRMLAKEPLRRPQSADALVRELMTLEIETLETRLAG